MADILVVEDDINIRADLTEILRDHGYDVFAARDGQTALTHLKNDGPPSLILLDLTMPVMSGWEFRKAQLRDPALAHVPVLILSGDAAIAQEAASMHAAGFIQKPFSLESLVQTVQAHLAPAVIHGV
jgi:CheY-like chemotaxis protein